MSVDGSFIQANADHHSRVPREQLAEVAKVKHAVREYFSGVGAGKPGRSSGCAAREDLHTGIFRLEQSSERSIGAR